MSREAPRTLLELLISREPFTWVELEDRFNRLARERARETGERATSITWNQLQRIAAGKVTNPRPATARVLETMFGRPVAELVTLEPLRDTLILTRSRRTRRDAVTYLPQLVASYSVAH